MNIKGLFTLAAVALVGMANAEAEDHVARELQVTDVQSKLLTAINNRRQQKNLPDVCVNTELAAAAQSLAYNNAMTRSVSTTGTNNLTPSARYNAQGLTPSNSAVVVAAGYASVDDVLNAWTQKKSAVDDNYAYIGPGYAYNANSDYKHFWVLDFANGQNMTCQE